MKVSEPPKLATRILRFFSRHPDSEAILGDLYERYQARPSSIWYWRQTFIEMLDTIMRSGAIFRIILWASAGFVVSVCWGFYFTFANKANPVPSFINILVNFSQPFAGVVTAWYPDLPVGLRVVVFANVVTYALLGLILEMIRNRHRILQISK